MDLQGHPKVPRYFHRGLQRTVRACQRAVTKNARCYKIRVSQPSFYEILCHFYVVSRVLYAGCGKIYDALGNKSPHPGFMNGPDRTILKKIPVYTAGRTRCDHFQAPKKTTPVDRIRTEKSYLSRKNLFKKPFSQRQIIGKTPEKGHCRMRVPIDQTGQDNGLSSIDHLHMSSQKPKTFSIRLPNRHDFSVLYEQAAVLERLLSINHRYDGASFDDNISARFGWLQILRALISEGHRLRSPQTWVPPAHTLGIRG